MIKYQHITTVIKHQSISSVIKYQHICIVIRNVKLSQTRVRLQFPNQKYGVLLLLRLYLPSNADWLEFLKNCHLKGLYTTR